MCGLAGVVIRASARCDSLLAVERMCERMRSRGPDAKGLWASTDGRVTLGHRRLAIIDLNSRANQPMQSSDGRYAIVFNGEIYNYQVLRDELETQGVCFQTTSDTEVLLALWAREGEAMLSRLRGMFALAIYDNERRCVTLARDPYGIKPLYTAITPAGFLFASQVKALLASNLVSRDRDPQAVAAFYLLGSVPEPHTWFRDIRAVPAGSWCRITEDGIGAPQRYWDIGDAWREASARALDQHEVADCIRSAVHDSVRNHMVADVPIGLFLSGGIDSGSLAGLMRDVGARELRAVTIAFDEFSGKTQDEAPDARRLAAHYQLDHSVRRVTRDEFAQDLPRILEAMDQPSIDGINTWFVAKAVAELGLKVAMSGIGGDELFHGYSNFYQVPRLVRGWRAMGFVPGARRLAGSALAAWSRHTGNPRWAALPSYAGNLHAAWTLRRGLFLPQELPALMGEEAALVDMQQLLPDRFLEEQVGALSADAGSAIAQMESMVYLRNQLLRDSDWASMAHSVELRTPLVDAWFLRTLTPALGSFSGGKAKLLLAASPNKPMPLDLARRRKSGFGIPVGQWLHAAADVSGFARPVAHSQSTVSREVAMLAARNVYGP